MRKASFYKMCFETICPGATKDERDMFNAKVTFKVTKLSFDLGVIRKGIISGIDVKYEVYTSYGLLKLTKDRHTSR